MLKQVYEKQEKTLKESKINVKGIASSLKMDPPESFRLACQNLCKTPNKDEPEVFDSSDEDLFMCLCYDEHFDNQCRIKILKPYVCKFEGTVSFGWIDASGNFVVNQHRPVHPGDHEKVVAFRKL